MQNLFHLGFGRRLTPETAMVDIQIGLVNRRTGEYAVNNEVNVSSRSLLDSLVCTVAANALIGCLANQAISLGDALTKDNIAANGGSMAHVFAAVFLADVAVREIERRWKSRRQNKFMDRAAGWERVEAKMVEGRGVWVVSRDGFELPEGAIGQNAAALREVVTKGNAAILSEAEFRDFERRVAKAGGVLRTYRLDAEGKNTTVMTKVGGRLQSVDGEPAVEVWEGDKLTREEWYDNGRRMAAPGTGPIDERKYGALLRDWQENQDKTAKVAIIRLALSDIRQAVDQVRRPDLFEDDDRKVVKYAQNLLLGADATLRMALGDDFEPVGFLGLDVDNLDGLAHWPRKTAEQHRAITLAMLAHTIRALDAEVMAVEEPKLAFFAERIRASLRHRDNDTLAGRFRDDLPSFNVALRRLDDGTPAVLVTPEDTGDEHKPEPMVVTQWEGGLDIRLPGQAPVRVDGERCGEDVRKFLGLPAIASRLERRRPCQDETTEAAPGRAP
jgi:hypothetical protein